MVGTLPQSARSLQVCVTMRETERESWEQRDTQMGRIESETNEEMRTEGDRWKEKLQAKLKEDSSRTTEDIVDCPLIIRLEV